MRIASRRKAIITFLILGVSLAAVAVAVGMGWIILNWREGIRVFLGVLFFSAITAGLSSTQFFWYAKSAAMSSTTALSTRSLTN